jgi:hypothetical protein
LISVFPLPEIRCHRFLNSSNLIILNNLSVTRLHNEELRDLYSSPSIIRIIKSRRMRWVGHVARMGEKRNAYRLLVAKRPLGRRRHRWVDNIRMDLGEVEWDDVDWIGLAKDRNRWRALVNSVLNLLVP